MKKSDKTISNIRKSFHDNYNNFVESISKLNNQLVELAKQTDELLSFIETSLSIKQDIVPKQE